MQITLVVSLWVTELLLLNFHGKGSFRSLLVKRPKQFINLGLLLGIELLDSIFDLVHRVQLQTVLVNWIDHFVHPVEEDSDGLLYLLITHQVLKVAI